MAKTKERKVNFVIGAKNRAKKVLRRLGNSLRSLKTAGMNIGRSLAKGIGIGAVAIGGLVTGFGLLIKRVSETQDAIGKNAAKLGLGTKALTGLHLAAEQAGIEVKTMNKSLQMMAIGLSDAAAGTGEAKTALEDLGLDAARLSRMEPDKALLKIVDALDKIENQSDKVRIASDIFGARGVGMINLTAASIASAREEVEAFGTALDRKTVKSFESFNDNAGRIKKAMSGFATQLASRVVPVLDKLFGRVVAFAKEGGLAEWGRKVGDAIAGAIPKIVGFVETIYTKLSSVFELVGNAVSNSGVFGLLKQGFDVAAGAAGVLAERIKPTIKMILEFLKTVLVFLVKQIPNAIILVLAGIELIAKAFTGWKMLWAELRYQFGGFMLFIWEGLNKARTAVLAFQQATNIFGSNDDVIQNSKRIASEQRQIIEQIKRDRLAALKDQQGAINEQKGDSAAMDKYIAQALSMEEAFKKAGDSLTESMTKSADDSIKQLDRVEKKVAKIANQKFGNLGADSDWVESALESVTSAKRSGG